MIETGRVVAEIMRFQRKVGGATPFAKFLSISMQFYCISFINKFNASGVFS